MITQYEFSLIHRFLMQNSMISHYFGIFEAMYHWEENDSLNCGAYEWSWKWSMIISHDSWDILTLKMNKASALYSAV